MDLLTNEEYLRAYEKWYCVTAKNPVSFSQYQRIMSRLPQDIKTINTWLDEGRKPI